MAKIKLHELIDGYENASGGDFVGKRFFRREITGHATVSTARQKKSKINRLAHRISHLLSYTHIKTYGFFFLTFGLLTVLFYFAHDFVAGYLPIGENTISLTLGVILSILSVPMLILDGPISLVLQEYPITDAIFFDFLCIKRMPPTEDEPAANPVGAVVLGAILAIIGLFLPTMLVVGVILFLAYFYLSFLSPEFSLFSTILILPYISLDEPEGYGILASLVIITAISFSRKLVFGKRVLNLEQYDILIFIMLLAVLISGIFLKGIESFEWSIKYISLSLVYILAGNIITNRRLADCAMNAIIFSSALPAVTSVVEFIHAIAVSSIEEIYYNGISSVFYSREIAAAHFAVSVAMAVAMAVQTKGFIRAGYISVGVLTLAGLVFTFEPFAYIAFIVGIMAYFCLRRGGLINLLVLPLAAVPYLILLLPGELLSRVFGMTTDGIYPSDILTLWSEAAGVFSKNLLLGIGIGSEAFAEEISFAGVTNCHNLFLEIATEAGIIALVAFIMIIWVRMRHRIVYQRYLNHSDVKLISASAASAIFVLITLGATTYIWQDLSLYYLFWCVFGIGSATLRIAKQDRDDRVLYYQIDRDVDNFDIAVNLEKH
jgi:hypothetical protein